MKTSLLLWLYLVGTAIEPHYASRKLVPSLQHEASGALREQDPSGIISREHVSRRTSTYKELRHIWDAAVTTSDTTSTVSGKCRLQDGTVVVIGGSYSRSESSRSSKASSKSGKGHRTLKKSKASPKSMMMSKSKGSWSYKSSKGSKSSSGKKGGGYHEDIPYCSTDPLRVFTSAPTFAATSTPTLSPTTADDFERCNDIRDDTGNTTEIPDQIMTLFVLVESNQTLDTNFSGRLNTAIRGILAVASGCRNRQITRRRLQNTPPSAVEINGFELTDLEGQNCEDAFGVDITSPVCTTFASLLRIFGGTISQEAILQACRDEGPEVASTLGVNNIQCAFGLVPAPTASPSNVNFVPATPGPGTQQPTPDNSNRSGGIRGTGDDEVIDTPGWIGMAAGLLVLLSLCLCFFCYLRARREREKSPAYTKTFDEEDSLAHNDHLEEQAPGSGAAKRNVIFVNETIPDTDDYEFDQYPTTDIAPTDEDEEYPVHRQDFTRGSYFDPPEEASDSSPLEEIQLHEKGQLCSSPTCRICEDRRNQVSFVPASPAWSHQNEYPSRGYGQDDTVEL